MLFLSVLRIVFARRSSSAFLIAVGRLAVFFGVPMDLDKAERQSDGGREEDFLSFSSSPDLRLLEALLSWLLAVPYWSN